MGGAPAGPGGAGEDPLAAFLGEIAELDRATEAAQRGGGAGAGPAGSGAGDGGKAVAVPQDVAPGPKEKGNGRSAGPKARGHGATVARRAVAVAPPRQPAGPRGGSGHEPAQATGAAPNKPASGAEAAPRPPPPTASQQPGPTMPPPGLPGPAMPPPSMPGPAMPPPGMAGPAMPSLGMVGPAMPPPGMAGPAMPPPGMVGPTMPPPGIPGLVMPGLGIPAATGLDAAQGQAQALEEQKKLLLSQQALQHVKRKLEEGRQVETVGGPVKRHCAGKTWVDHTLGDWPANDHRMFVGNLSSEVTDDFLARAFSKYPTFQRAKVIKDKFKPRAYGFVSFGAPGDFAQAMREMNGKYIGNRPCQLSKSRWEDRTADKEGSSGKGKKPKNKRNKPVLLRSTFN